MKYIKLLFFLLWSALIVVGSVPLLASLAALATPLAVLMIWWDEAEKRWNIYKQRPPDQFDQKIIAGRSIREVVQLAGLNFKVAKKRTVKVGKSKVAMHEFGFSNINDLQEHLSGITTWGCEDVYVNNIEVYPGGFLDSRPYYRLTWAYPQAA